MPNGEQIFKFSRGCRTNAVAPEGSCAEGQLTGMQYKDCVTTCDTDNCNDDLVGFVKICLSKIFKMIIYISD